MTDGTPNNAPAAGTLAADPAYAALDPVLRGTFENKGWHGKSPFEAAVEVAKSYTEVEKHLGIPRDQLLRFPKDAADTEGWKALNTRLGVPEKVDGYDLSSVKSKDGAVIDDNLAGAMKAAFLAEGVPASRAAGLAGSVVKYLDGVKETETAKLQAALTEGKAKLDQSWGPNKAANTFIAGQAVSKLGLTKDFIETVEKTAGYEPTMQMLLKLGQMMGEDRFVQGQGGNKGVLTREQAMARKAELFRDENWAKKVNNGDFAANEELIALDRVIAGIAA